MCTHARNYFTESLDLFLSSLRVIDSVTYVSQVKDSCKVSATIYSNFQSAIRQRYRSFTIKRGTKLVSLLSLLDDCFTCHSDILNLGLAPIKNATLPALFMTSSHLTFFSPLRYLTYIGFLHKT